MKFNYPFFDKGISIAANQIASFLMKREIFSLFGALIPLVGSLD
jgi:hypothetical protein